MLLLYSLISLWHESHGHNLEPELRGPIIGVKSYMDTFNYFYGVTKLELVLRKPSTTACHGKKVAELTLVTLNYLRSDEIFYLTRDKVLKDANTLQLTEASLLRKRKKPAKILFENETFCRYIYFNVIDTVVSCVKDRFAQAVYQFSRNIAQLLYKRCEEVWNFQVTKSSYETELSKMASHFELPT